MAHWTDKEMLTAVLRRDNIALERIYRDCKLYFHEHAASLYNYDANLDDIFQEALTHLWREIETHRIEWNEGHICRWVEGHSVPMTCSLLTFLMAIARRKNWEYLRKQHQILLTDNDHILETLDKSRFAEPIAMELTEAEQRERVVADIVLAMSERCRHILTLFYYEHRSLDDILLLRPENQSKQGLKTSKYKCMQRLREQVRERFRQLHLSAS